MLVGLLGQREKQTVRVLDGKWKCEQGDIKTKMRSNFTAKVWKKNNQNVNILKNKHAPWAQGNFCDKHKQALTPVIAWGKWKNMTT